MSCNVCLQTNQSSKGLYNDCIIESLEKIKTHYLHFKTQLDERNREIQKLQSINEELKLNLSTLKSSPKRRKTSSFEDSPTVSEKSTTDCLNDAIKVDPSWDESFFVGTQSRTDTPKNILKAANHSPDRSISPSANVLRPSPSGGLLPRRLKSTPLSSRHREINRTPTGVENRSPKWISKEDIKSNGEISLIKREWNMSFIQPPPPAKKTTDGVSSPRLVGKEFKSPSKNILSLKKEANLKQTRLKFDTSKAEIDREETIVPETDETFCADLIAPSPTIESKNKQKSIRKVNRHRLQSTCATINKNALSKLEIKIEPSSAVKKNINFDEESSKLKTFAEATPSPPSLSKSRLQSEDNISGIDPYSDSSVCILPSQSNDVIIVEDTIPETSFDIDSAALFDEMMLKTDETSDFLKKVEEKCISNLKQQKGKRNIIARTISGDLSPAILPTSKEIKFLTIPKSKDNQNEQIKKKDQQVKVERNEEDNTKGSTSNESPPANNKSDNSPAKIVPQWSCKECESFYELAGRNMPEQELLKRMKNCQENHRRTIYSTPEGFWNPCFPPTLEGICNKTLEDSKLVNTKKK